MNLIGSEFTLSGMPISSSGLNVVKAFLNHCVIFSLSDKEICVIMGGISIDFLNSIRVSVDEFFDSDCCDCTRMVQVNMIFGRIIDRMPNIALANIIFNKEYILLNNRSLKDIVIDGCSADLSYAMSEVSQWTFLNEITEYQ